MANDKRHKQSFGIKISQKTIIPSEAYIIFTNCHIAANTANHFMLKNYNA